MPRLRHAAPLLAAALALPLPSQEAPAADDAGGPRPCRELFTTAAAVTDTGVLQLNAGAQDARDRDGGEARRFPSQLALGAVSWFDLRVAWSGPTTLKDPEGNRRSGGGDPLFGGQAQALRQDRAGLDLGVEGGWTAQGERWAVDAGLVWRVGRFWGK